MSYSEEQYKDMATSRVSWEYYALKLAFAAAIRSEDPYAQVGACALNHHNEVLGVAYNGLVSGKDVDFRFWKDRDKRRPFMVHAEENLLSLFKRHEAKLVACTMLPCTTCARNICARGVKKVVYCQEYEGDLFGKEIFKFYDVELIKIPQELIHEQNVQY